MNLALIATGIIFLICIIVGICKGAIRIGVSLLTTIVTFLIVSFATPYVAKAIDKYTPIDEAIEEQVEEAMIRMVTNQVQEAGTSGNLSAEGVKKVLNAAGITEETLQQYGVTVDDIVSGKVGKEELAKYGISASLLDGLYAGGKEASTKEVLDLGNVPREMQISAINTADIPAIFKTLLIHHNNEEEYKRLGVDSFGGYVGAYLADLIVKILAFLGTFLLTIILLRAIIFALNIVSELPVIGFLNRLGGGILGGVGALVIVWILFVVITLLYTTGVGKEIYDMIQNDTILRTIYDGNPVMKIITLIR